MAWDDRFSGTPGEARVWGYCAYCGDHIDVGDAYRQYEGDAVCRSCEKPYALDLFYELSTRETARDEE